MRFPFLDLVRAGACIWVALAHLTLITGHPIFLLSQGGVAVDVFIFTSGFLMCLVYPAAQTVAKTEAVSFYIRRWFRIAPAFYCAVLAYVCLHHFFRDGLQFAEAYFDTPFRDPFNNVELSWTDVLLNLTFLHGLFPGSSVALFGPAWSISLEMQFYLVVPVMMVAMRRSPGVTLLICFLINLLADYCFGLFGHRWLWDYPHPSFLPSRIYLFAVGAVACLFLQVPRRGLFLMLMMSQAGAFGLFGYKSGSVILAVTVLLIFSTRSPRFSRLCSLSWVKHLAEYSYGIYLFHVLFMGSLAGIVLKWLPVSLSDGPAAFIYGFLVLVGATGFSAMVFHWIENPLRELGRKLSKFFLTDK